MTWPLTKDQISPQDIIGQDIFGDPIYDPHDKVLALTYVANGGTPETVRVQFPYKDWKAGTRIRFVIEFTDKSIQMVSEVLPDNATIHLTTVSPEITCKLFISSLKGATLVINKVGADPSYFTVEPSTMTITGERMYFVVKPSNLPTGGQTRTMNLSFSVALPSGREIDGDSEILGNDHNYTFSRQ